ncbi:MAG TPA: hypothetical protein VHQ64_20425, partial [Pyrinomonadaceae bacterium]|nr:hypothetical protein [Pyrinomonadaceae bacterium]
RRLTGGLQIQSSYTLSRAYDNGQSSVTFSSNNLPWNAFDQQGEGALSAFDRRHKFVYSMVYNTHYANKDNAFLHAFLNGWTISPIFNWFSGARYTPTISGSTSLANNFGLSGSTPGGGINGTGGSTRIAFLPRNPDHTPSIQYLDLRVSRRFPIGEKARIEVLGEAFNFFNRTQITAINTSGYSVRSSGCSAAAPCPFLDFNTAFGQVTGADSTLFRERQVQLAVRFEF